MKYGHFEMVRWTCGRKLPDKSFSLWRVDAPWQPVTKKVPYLSQTLSSEIIFQVN